MKLEEALDLLPPTKNALVILSGGMDSTIAMRLAVEKYGEENVKALSFDYGQRQDFELNCAEDSAYELGVVHKIMDLRVLGYISHGFSANVDTNIKMPKIQDILGDPRPVTYVPNRNMIMMSLAASFAEVNNIQTVIMGLQQHDEYNYHDTTQRFVAKVNDVLTENRIIQIKIISPFASLSKTDELNLLYEMDENFDLMRYTLTCYDPDRNGRSCGQCPSCSERMKAFQNIGETDPVEYQ